MFVLPTLVIFATAAFGRPYKRSDGLTVDISGPGNSVTSIEDLKFTATVTNTNAGDVKVLKYGTVLDGLPSRSFTVTKGGVPVDFTGIQLNIAMSDSAYLTIPSGANVTVEHNVADLYDFASAGKGTFAFEPITDFRVAGAEERVASPFSAVKAIAEIIEVEVTSEVTRRSIKRATDVCANATLSEFINASYVEAKELASISLNYISTLGNSSNNTVTAYFSTNPVQNVTDKLELVANENDSSRTLNCLDDYGVCDGNVIAYTVISTTDIYFCSIFFDEVPATDLCSGTTTVAARNLTHAVADTEDITYGCVADQGLTAAQQIINADSFNCFVTQVYNDTQC
ncbi:Metalloprotease [Guyanagaster necrorhizus]|uniref:deuterolysin n=1 Tax=Guyanagaster necrorhizus TaxID=856835 RepID=A0A9P7VLF3_9AGAR|nr:Metalloprotease [Guyanagaster necrorhizus MCA 3950]KAG7442718.1 Metalloprotease [Guyanagaster necrorhizus MCA 3950]